MTEQCGIGAYTKKAFKKGDILGWYAGEILSRAGTKGTGYTYEMEVGDVMGCFKDFDIKVKDFSNPAEAVDIDASRMGN
jgi:hypothetical protein